MTITYILFGIYIVFLISFLVVSILQTKKYFDSTIDGFIHHPSALNLIIYFHAAILILSLVFFIFYLKRFNNQTLTLNNFLYSIIIIFLISIFNYFIYEIMYKVIKAKLRNDGFIAFSDIDGEPIDSEYTEELLKKEYRTHIRNFVGLLSIFYLFFYIFPTTVTIEPKILKNQIKQAPLERDIVEDAKYYHGSKWFLKLVDARRKYIKKYGMNAYIKNFSRQLGPVEQDIIQYELKQQMNKYLIPAAIIKKQNNYEFAGIIEELLKKFPIDDVLLFSHFFKDIDIIKKKTLLSQQLKKNILRNMYIENELKTIYSACAAAEIAPPVLLKGAAYMFSIYKSEPGFRFLSDIDVLIKNSEHLVDFSNLLNKLGYFRGSKYHETFEKNNIKIDVHTSLLNSNRISWRKNFFAINNLYQIAEKKNNFLVLPENIDFLYCLLHSAIHHGFNGFKWLADCKLFIENSKLQPLNIYDTAIKYNVCNQIKFCLTVYSQFFLLPEKWIEIFQIPYKNFIAKKIIARNSYKYQQYFVNFLFCPLMYKPGLIFNLFFPSRKILELRYPFSSNIFFLYKKHFAEILKHL